MTNPDDIFKYRRRNLVDEINEKLNGVQISVYDIQCIAYIYDIYKNEKFTYLPTYSSPQYSVAFAEWVVEQYKKDGEFFSKARQEYYKKKFRKNK